MTTITVEQYCKENGILYLPFSLSLTTDAGKTVKKPLSYKSGKFRGYLVNMKWLNEKWGGYLKNPASKKEDWMDEKEKKYIDYDNKFREKFKFQDRQECVACLIEEYPKLEYIAIDTDEYPQLDCDEPVSNIDELTSSDHYLSVGKNLPHVFCERRLYGDEHGFRVQFEKQDEWGCKKVEYLNGQWAWSKRTTEMVIKGKKYNDTQTHKLIDESKKSNVIKEVCSRDGKKATNRATNKGSQEVKGEFLYEISHNISVEYLDDYDSWIQIMWALMNDNYYENKELAREISSKSVKFDPGEFDDPKFWKQGGHKLSIGTVMRYSKMSNKQRYLEIINKHRATLGVFSDRESAQRLIELYPHWKNSKRILYVFDDETGMWSANIDLQMKIISRYEVELCKLVQKEDGSIKKSKLSYGSSVTLIHATLQFIRTLCIDDGWERRTRSSGLLKILFADGYWDGENNKFVTEFNPDIVFHNRIQTNFVDVRDSDPEYCKDIVNRLFLQQHDAKTAKYYIQLLARGLMGEVMKKITFGIGKGDSGKGIICKAVSSAFEDLVGVFNANSLAVSNQNIDSAALVRWLLIDSYKRLMFGNELKIGAIYDGELIKKYASGGDEMSGRLNHQDERSFVAHFLMVVYANDMYDIEMGGSDGAPIRDRLEIFHFKKKFCKNPDPENPMELQMVYDMEKEFTTKKFKDAFIKVFIDAYADYIKNGVAEQPQSCIDARNKFVGEKTIIMDEFNQDFTITNSIEDSVSVEEVRDWLENDLKAKISIKTFNVDLMLHCEQKGFTNTKTSRKYVNNRRTRCWIGIKRVVRTDILDDEDLL